MAELKEKTCCFTGHRDIPILKKGGVVKRLRQEITALIEKGYCYFGSGGALGFDTIAAQMVLDLKKDYPDIKLILVLPCTNQDQFWKASDKEVYEDLKSKADKIVYTSDRPYYSGCMFKRNRHLVDCSSVCICYLTKEDGGTAYTCNYAKSRNLPVINVACRK